MTELLCLSDSYVKTCGAYVKEVIGNKVVLDKTVFYPRGGGQPGDSGFFRNSVYEYRVADTTKEEENVFHVIEGVVPPSNSEVQCEIDWDRRYAHMRHHSAIHVLSGIVQKKFGAEITGGQIYSDKARVDFDLPDTSRQQIIKLENEANQIVFEGHPIVARYISKQEALEIPSLVRTKTGKVLVEALESIRVVEIVNFDVQADGGTHVKNTKEIGQIRIANVENKGKHNKRVEVVLEHLMHVQNQRF